MKFHWVFYFCFCSSMFFAQQKEVDFDAVDSLYREDQICFSFVHNSLQKFPSGITESKFSPGFTIGFLRDMPVNKSRTFSIAPGLGYNFSIYNHNIEIIQSDGSNIYQTFDAQTTFSKNKFFFHAIDLPIELRWRNSTPESHKFWRIYSGFRMSYLFADIYKSVNSAGITKISNNKDLNKFQYGVYMAVGWNTWNIHVYYGLNSMFHSTAKIDGLPLKGRAVNFGLMFYIL